jgi:hypothetical protein
MVGYLRLRIVAFASLMPCAKKVEVDSLASEDRTKSLGRHFKEVDFDLVGKRTVE